MIFFIQANMQIYTFLKEDLGSMVRQVITLDEVEGDIYGLSMNAKTDENARKESMSRILKNIFLN